MVMRCAQDSEPTKEREPKTALLRMNGHLLNPKSQEDVRSEVQPQPLTVLNNLLRRGRKGSSHQNSLHPAHTMHWSPVLQASTVLNSRLLCCSNAKPCIDCYTSFANYQHVRGLSVMQTRHAKPLSPKSATCRPFRPFGKY